MRGLADGSGRARMDGWVGALGREGEVHAQSVNVGGKGLPLPSHTAC